MTARKQSLRKLFSVLAIGLILALSHSGCGIAGYNSFRSSRPAQYFHIVKKGETLASIGNRYSVDYERIALLNGILDARALQIGQRLLIPVAGEIEASTSYRGGGGGGGGVIAPSVPSAKLLERYSGGRLLWPVRGGSLVSGFGRRWGTHHDGIDIAAASGTPIYASHDAEVIYSDDKLRGYGNLVILRSSDGLTTVYGHNRRNQVKLGAKVKRGQQIAEVGATGKATGPHLHYEVRMQDRQGRFIAVDPVPFLKANSSTSGARSRVNENLTPIIGKNRR